eukprot:2440258-Rhodomonas_salina.9
MFCTTICMPSADLSPARSISVPLSARHAQIRTTHRLYRTRARRSRVRGNLARRTARAPKRPQISRPTLRQYRTSRRKGVGRYSSESERERICYVRTGLVVASASAARQATLCPYRTSPSKSRP